MRIFVFCSSVTVSVVLINLHTCNLLHEPNTQSINQYIDPTAVITSTPLWHTSTGAVMTDNPVEPTGRAHLGRRRFDRTEKLNNSTSKSALQKYLQSCARQLNIDAEYILKFIRK